MPQIEFGYVGLDYVLVGENGRSSEGEGEKIDIKHRNNGKGGRDEHWSNVPCHPQPP